MFRAMLEGPLAEDRGRLINIQVSTKTETKAKTKTKTKLKRRLQSVPKNIKW